MRCPKCQYISFDNGERCRNCGYEFSLTVDDPQVDVTIRREEPRSGRLQDVSLTALDTPISATPSPPRADTDDGDRRSNARRPLTAADLPLFTDRVADDQAPLVSPSAVPRPPLSVRRANPAARPRVRTQVPEELSLDLAADAEEREPGVPLVIEEPHATSGDAASVFRRAAAGLIDTIILGAIQIAVVYLTLRVSGLTLAEWRLLPLAPLIAFLLLLCGGYFILFTAAGGQTIGKMAARIRVVAAPSGERGDPRVSFQIAFVRAVASLGSVLALGAGFLPVIFSADRRAFHDRVAETRVVVA